LRTICGKEETDFGVEDLRACVDVVDIDQDAWSDSIAIESGFVFAQTKKGNVSSSGTMIAYGGIARNQIHGAFIVVICTG
jgi:hypothetical protein